MNNGETESRVMEDIFFIDHNVWLNHFNDMDQNGRVLAEYIWIGGSGQDLRSKTKVNNKIFLGIKLKDYPKFYDYLFIKSNFFFFSLVLVEKTHRY